MRSLLNTTSCRMFLFIAFAICYLLGSLSALKMVQFGHDIHYLILAGTFFLGLFFYSYFLSYYSTLPGKNN